MDESCIAVLTDVWQCKPNKLEKQFNHSSLTHFLTFCFQQHHWCLRSGKILARSWHVWLIARHCCQALSSGACLAHAISRFWKERKKSIFKAHFATMRFSKYFVLCQEITWTARSLWLTRIHWTVIAFHILPEVTGHQGVPFNLILWKVLIATKVSCVVWLADKHQYLPKF